MEIIKYTPDFLTSLTQFYNDFTVDVPHCHPVKEEDIAFATSGVTGQSKYYDADDIKSETAFVAVQDGKVLAFIHLGLSKNTESSGQSNGRGNIDDKTAHILFFGYKVGERQIGAAILKEAEDYLQQNEVTKVYAFSRHYRYPCYHFAYAQLSDRLGHVEALLGYNNYRRTHGQAFFDWENFNVTPTPPDIPVSLSVEWKEGRGKLPNCNITAHKDGEEVGVCWSLSGGTFSSHPDAQDWVYTDWLGVDEAYQGQGLGKYLLLYSLQEMHKVGYRHAALSTDWSNNSAFLLYGNCGYKVVDWTYMYSKRLEKKSEIVIPVKSENRFSEVVNYTPDLLQPLTHFYNHQVHGLPNCFPVSEDEFATVLGGLNKETERSKGELEEQALFLTIKKGQIKAFVHVGFKTYHEDDEDREDEKIGYIRFLGCERGERQAGQVVLEKAEAYLNSFEIKSIEAFSSDDESRYPFFSFEYAKLTNYLDHIQGLLGNNSYRPSNGWVFLNWENFTVEPVLPDDSVHTSVTWTEGRGERANCTVAAQKGNTDVGECQNVSAGMFSRHPDAQDWTYTEWLGIADGFRGKGFGKFLLQYALQEMQKAGYRHASISTDLSNNRAILFYSNLGYKVADWTYEYGKTIR